MDIPRPHEHHPAHHTNEHSKSFGNGHLFGGHPRFHASQRPREEKYITIRLTPRTAERGIFLLIIALLLISHFWNPFSKDSMEEVTGYETLETEEQAEPEPVETVTSPAVEPEPVEEPVVEEEPEPVEEELVLEGETVEEAPEEPACEIDPELVELSIVSVIYDKQSEFYGKLKELRITILNEACFIRPLIKTYVWDDSWYDLDSNTQHALATKQQGDDWKFDSGIETGEFKEFTLDTSIMFSELDLEKAVTLKLYDSEANRLMGEATARFRIED
jgi:hypothetical protein